MGGDPEAIAATLSALGRALASALGELDALLLGADATTGSDVQPVGLVADSVGARAAGAGAASACFFGRSTVMDAPITTAKPNTNATTVSVDRGTLGAPASERDG